MVCSDLRQSFTEFLILGRNNEWNLKMLRERLLPELWLCMEEQFDIKEFEALW